MKRALVVIVLVIVGVSCLVDRKSDDFACDNDADCAKFADARECDQGHCVKASCPGICESCTTGTVKMCNIDCDTPSKCRNGISCPTGYTCNFDCSENCKPENCVTLCTVDCSDAAADCTCNATNNCTCSGVGTCQ